jgi:2-amino-4-hydroxy-6-hydroxymethyldihydropteridine diphosphokinase
VIRYLILSGSNLGNRVLLLAQALKKLEELSVMPVDNSKLYESEPWGFETEFRFLNQAIIIHSDLKPEQILGELLSIENALGRQRTDGGSYESRTIDLDILLADQLIIDDIKLQVPHPRMHVRKFALKPAAEIAGDWIHPGLNLSIGQLLDICEDKSEVTAIK